MTRVVHADRQGLAPWLFGSLVASVAVALSVAGSIVATTNGQPLGVGLLAGITVAALAAWGLPSVSLRLVARIALVVSGSAIARFATVGPELENGTQTILLWLLAAVTTLVLTSRVDHHAVPAAGTAAERSGIGDAGTAPSAIGSSTGGPAAAGPASVPTRAGRTVAHVVVVAAIVVAVVTVLAPFAVSRAGSEAAAGRGPTSPPVEGSSPLRSTDSLDMTTRPDLTDDVVLTVRSDYDLFLRGDVFDRWDGTRWSKSSTDRYALLGGDRVTTSPIDLGATGGAVVQHTIRVEAGYADVFFATPTPVAIDSRLPVVQTLDGTLLTRRGGMGRGETYTVTSRRIPLSEELLRSVEGQTFPAPVTRVYAEDPVATDRVRSLADQIVASSGAATTYDRIRALEDWMDDNLEYSIDAPTSPKGSDVVDDFLFRSKVGWCEQIASSLVVMARSQGIPARLATGYVMDERDPVTGRYIVRARNAHAWAEVWFPDLGWVPFDPTAGVPLALERPSDDTLADWILDHLVQLLVGTAAVVVLAVVGRRVLRRMLARRRDRPQTWAAGADRRLTRLGEARGVARLPGDTAAAYAARLAESEPGAGAGDGPDLVPVGQVVDDHLFAPVPPSADDIARAEAVLAAAESPAPAPTDPPT